MKNYIYLMRLDKPTGFLLLFWPCSWGMAYNLNYLQISYQWFYFLFLFFVGSILMRSAGCIYNDIVDKEIDKKVERTKNRPLASGKVSLRNAWILILTLCFLSLIILFQFNIKTIFFSLSIIFIVLLYPFAKRFTYWPQLILGVVFNFGILLSWLSLNESFITGIILLYLSGIFWTVATSSLRYLLNLLCAGLPSPHSLPFVPHLYFPPSLPNQSVLPISPCKPFLRSPPSAHSVAFSSSISSI